MKTKNTFFISFRALVVIALLLFQLSPSFAQQNKQPKPGNKNQNSNQKKDPKEKEKDEKDDQYFLELKGSVYQSKGSEDEDKAEKLAVDSAVVKIMTGITVVAEIATNKKGKCMMRLPLNQTFKVIILKRGFVTKYFEVNTKVPANKKALYAFSFDIDIFEEVKGLDVSVLKKPIAKVEYDAIEDRFEYDENYTNRINFDLKKLYKSYYEFHASAKDTLKNGGTPPKTNPKGKVTPTTKTPANKKTQAKK